MSVPIETTFHVIQIGADLYEPAIDAIRDWYADQAGDPADQFTPPLPPNVKLLTIELTGASEIDLEDGQPVYEARVRWEET